MLVLGSVFDLCSIYYILTIHRTNHNTIRRRSTILASPWQLLGMSKHPAALRAFDTIPSVSVPPELQTKRNHNFHFALSSSNIYTTMVSITAIFIQQTTPTLHSFWGLLVICSAQNVEIFDLLALRAEEVDGTDGPTWPLVAQKLRQVLSQPNVLKIVPWDQSFKRNARVSRWWWLWSWTSAVMT